MRRAGGFSPVRWCRPLRRCCTKAHRARSFVPQTRETCPNLPPNCANVPTSPAPSCQPAATGSPRSCCPTAVTAWRCGPMARASAAGVWTAARHRKPSHAGAMTHCGTTMALLFTCANQAAVRCGRSPSTRRRTLTGITKPLFWRTGWSLKRRRTSCMSRPPCWSARKTTPNCALCEFKTTVTGSSRLICCRTSSRCWQMPARTRPIRLFPTCFCRPNGARNGARCC